MTYWLNCKEDNGVKLLVLSLKDSHVCISDHYLIIGDTLQFNVRIYFKSISKMRRYHLLQVLTIIP